MREIAVLGAGVAGLAFAQVLAGRRDCQVTVFEKEDVAGGVARSFCVDGFTFDFGIHGLYTTDKRVLSLFQRLMRRRHRVIRVEIRDYCEGRWIRHPLQMNLGGGLPQPLVLECLQSYLEARIRGSKRTYRNYQDWCERNLGRVFSERFQFPYCRKFWTVGPEALTHDWMGPRVRSPSFAEIMEGVLYRQPSTAHYVTEVCYPSRGGFGEYALALARGINVSTRMEIVGIEPNTRALTFADGGHIRYDALLTTIPLPSLISLISGAPANVVRAANDLCWTSLAVVSLGVARARVLPFHWVYAYDAALPFARLSSPSRWAPRNAPEGASSLQAEVYFRGAPPNGDQTTEDVLNALRTMNVLQKDDEIIAQDFRTLAYANVVYDHRRERALSLIHEYLRSKGIEWAGRYGNWDYSLIDQVVSDAQAKAVAMMNSWEG